MICSAGQRRRHVLNQPDPTHVAPDDTPPAGTGVPIRADEAVTLALDDHELSLVRTALTPVPAATTNLLATLTAQTRTVTEGKSRVYVIPAPDAQLIENALVEAVNSTADRGRRRRLAYLVRHVRRQRRQSRQ